MDCVIEQLAQLPDNLSGRDRRLNELQHVKTHLEPILAQTIARAIDGKGVDVADKVVSLFEPHSDVIVKGSRETEFGRKVFFTAGKSNLVTDALIAEGNPSDSDVYMQLIDRHRDHFGKPPRQTTRDGGFASQENIDEAKDACVRDVCFTKRVNFEPDETSRSKSVFKWLANFSAGLESNISALRRAFGLARVLWKGEEGFIRCVWSGVVAYNLVTLKH